MSSVRIETEAPTGAEIDSLLEEMISKGGELSDWRVHKQEILQAPDDVIMDIPQSEASKRTVLAVRHELASLRPEEDMGIIRRPDPGNRLLVALGPCSIHDVEEALEYAEHVKAWQQTFPNLLLVMRTYFEKPRTTIGWKGFLSDPHLDGSNQIGAGIRAARAVMEEITARGVPVATELLDTDTPQYFSDMLSLGAIGARTVESQPHRELVSGASFPVGFKNGTNGNVDVAIDAIIAAREGHAFFGMDRLGRAAKITTGGNPDCLPILRGGKDGPNCDPASIEKASEAMKDAGLRPAIMVDLSHANSGKVARNQTRAAQSTIEHINTGSSSVVGVMLESNLLEGAQKFNPLSGDREMLVRGQSITDECLGLDGTESILAMLSEAVQQRRHASHHPEV